MACVHTSMISMTGSGLGSCFLFFYKQSIFISPPKSLNRDELLKWDDLPQRDHSGQIASHLAVQTYEDRNSFHYS